MVLLYGHFIHFQGFSDLLFPCMLEGPAFFEANEHQMVPVGMGQAFSGGRDRSRSFAKAFIAFDLAAFQDDEESFSGPPEVEIEGLSSGTATGFEEGSSLGG